MPLSTRTLFPEPLWLHYNAAALNHTGAAVCVGHVRGRTCNSFQLCSESVDTEAETHSEQWRSDQPFVAVLATDRAVKLVGINFAIRR